GHQAPRQRARARGQRRAPGQLAPMIGDLLEVELDRLAHPLAEPKTRTVRAAFERVVLVEHDLDAGILTLGVGGQEDPQPALDFGEGPTGEHGVKCTFWWKGGAPSLPPPTPQRDLVSAAEWLRSPTAGAGPGSTPNQLRRAVTAVSPRFLALFSIA